MAQCHSHSKREKQVLQRRIWLNWIWQKNWVAKSYSSMFLLCLLVESPKCLIISASIACCLTYRQTLVNQRHHMYTPFSTYASWFQHLWHLIESFVIKILPSQFHSMVSLGLWFCQILSCLSGSLNCGARLHDTFSLVHFILEKPVMCGKYCKILLPVRGGACSMAPL